MPVLRPPLIGKTRWLKPLLRVLLVSGMLASGAAVHAQAFASLQQSARRCFEGNRPSCRTAMGISHQLRERADAKNALRCYTALLGVEAMLNLSLLGDPDQERKDGLLQQSAQECQALQI